MKKEIDNFVREIKNEKIFLKLKAIDNLEFTIINSYTSDNYNKHSDLALKVSGNELTLHKMLIDYKTFIYHYDDSYSNNSNYVYYVFEENNSIFLIGVLYSYNILNSNLELDHFELDKRMLIWFLNLNNEENESYFEPEKNNIIHQIMLFFNKYYLERKSNIKNKDSKLHILLKIILEEKK